jgi:hypothetical protein
MSCFSAQGGYASASAPVGTGTFTKGSLGPHHNSKHSCPYLSAPPQTMFINIAGFDWGFLFRPSAAGQWSYFAPGFGGSLYRHPLIQFVGRVPTPSWALLNDYSNKVDWRVAAALKLRTALSQYITSLDQAMQGVQFHYPAIVSGEMGRISWQTIGRCLR